MTISGKRFRAYWMPLKERNGCLNCLMDIVMGEMDILLGKLDVFFFFFFLRLDEIDMVVGITDVFRTKWT